MARLVVGVLKAESKLPSLQEWVFMHVLEGWDPFSNGSCQLVKHSKIEEWFRSCHAFILHSAAKYRDL